jgi:hypothetical protein
MEFLTIIVEVEEDEKSWGFSHIIQAAPLSMAFFINSCPSYLVP